MDKSIEALFGSKTRVKLLNLFFNNPYKKFYVREITRMIDEQVNSVRRELSNLQDAKIVKSTTEDRKVFYSVNQRQKFYLPLRVIFAGVEMSAVESDVSNPVDKWQEKIAEIKNSLEVMVISGALVDDSECEVDMLLVGDNSRGQLSAWASGYEKEVSRELNYVILTMSDFFYRYSTKDVFISQVFNHKHKIIVDTDEILKD